MLGSAALEQLGVGRHGRDGRAELVRGVGDELAQVLLVVSQPGLRCEPGRERGLNPLEHDVEGAGESAHLCRLVGARDPLVEVAGRDGVGGALDVLQRPQAEPDQPPACGEREDDGAGRDRELDEEQGVQRAGLVDQGLRLHEHVAVEVAADDLGRPHPERRTLRRRWSPW